jgi:ubiquinone/menaquinone biosynthesis C-methylase UbiE
MDLSYAAQYQQFVRDLVADRPQDEAMTLAAGGWDFYRFGVVMRELLIRAGLQKHHYLIDVGCGPARLAYALRGYLEGAYLGTDVVPDVLAHAAAICAKPVWRFELVDGIAIPEQDERADMVCFFSVLTHVFHQDAFRYLLEARRVLKPGGVVVFSFLEFSLGCAYEVFDAMVAESAERRPGIHSQFMSRDMIESWIPRLGFQNCGIEHGDKPLVTEGALGQSICVLRKP